MIRAYAAQEKGGKFQPFEYDPGPLGEEDVDVSVEYCGICHSDLSMLDNEWGFTTYPFVPGHEIVGKVAAVGEKVEHLQVGQTVGIGWFSRSCMTCEPCMSGNQNLCQKGEGVIVGRYGGFAERVRANHNWVIPLPAGVNPVSAGPLFCGGITVFNPIFQYVKSTDRVGVVGIGGLGHIALKYLSAWGCDVTAFSTNPAKETEARAMGAHHFVNSKDPEALKAVANSFDFIISTVNVNLDWDSYIAALRPKGRLHLVGVVVDPLSLSLFPLIMGNKSISASPVGSPTTIAKMLEFSALHHIEPMVEVFPMEQVNEAMERLRSGKARYRIVLQNN